VAVGALHAREARATPAWMVTSYMEASVTRVCPVAARRVSCSVVFRASLDSGVPNLTVTPGVLQGVTVVDETKLTAVVSASLDSGDLTVTCVLQGVRRAMPEQPNAPNAKKKAAMEISVNIHVILAVLIRHVTLHQESVMRVMMVILGHIVTSHATAHVLQVDAIETLESAMNVLVKIRTAIVVTFPAVIPVVTINVT